MPSFSYTFDAAGFDENFRLVGHPNGGVSIECRKCDMPSHPIAYHGDENPFTLANPEVVHARTPSALIHAAIKHRYLSIHYT